MPLGTLRDPDLAALLRALRSDRSQGRDAPEVTAEWSQALRDRLDDNLAATGSVGRGEAVPSSDLDVIRLGPGSTPRFDALLAAGVPGDANGVRPTGGVLAVTAEQWREDAARWMARPDQDLAVVRLGLLADACDPTDTAPVHLAAAEGFSSSPMLADMLRDAVSTCPPRLTGLWRKNSVDLKAEVLTPVVKIARWAALASGSSELSTPARLAAADARYLDPSTARDLQVAFTDALSLRVDLDLDVVDDRVFQRFGRITVTALPPDAARRLRAATTTVRHTVRTLRYLLSTSTFSVDTPPDAGDGGR
ncbi:putative nucleotidyltransferase substrate binding domain-containing protein [Corynebacterium sp. USCH3]|uniref:putative nucleotidyltransferase substrate binding domain-containing protein n=1 Tax=Corynebacterium sp. USCH3 TaxID=3024840 RepID=UPI0030B3D87F